MNILVILIPLTMYNNNFRRLNMSRSIGDLDLKPFGVTAQPEVIRRSVKHHKVSIK